MPGERQRCRDPGRMERRNTHLGNSHHRFPAYGQIPVHCSPLGCQASRPAAEPSSAGQWVQYGASPLSVSAGPEKPEGEGQTGSRSDYTGFFVTLPAQSTISGPHHQFFINDHLADNGVNSG